MLTLLQKISKILIYHAVNSGFFNFLRLVIIARLRFVKTI